MKTKLGLVAMLFAGTLPLAAAAADPVRPPATDPVRPPAADMPPAGNPGMSGSGGAPTNTAPIFQQLDRDGDGQISKEEARRSADALARFNALDTDRSGGISAAEWQAGEKH